jgi:hypothetical protein
VQLPGDEELVRFFVQAMSADLPPNWRVRFGFASP